VSLATLDARARGTLPTTAGPEGLAVGANEDPAARARAPSIDIPKDAAKETRGWIVDKGTPKGISLSDPGLAAEPLRRAAGHAARTLLPSSPKAVREPGPRRTCGTPRASKNRRTWLLSPTPRCPEGHVGVSESAFAPGRHRRTAPSKVELTPTQPTVRLASRRPDGGSEEPPSLRRSVCRTPGSRGLSSLPPSSTFLGSNPEGSSPSRAGSTAALSSPQQV